MTTPEGFEASARVQPAARSVSPLWRLVARRASAIASFTTTGNGPALFCVHPIFGDVTSFISLAQALGDGQRFYGIQVPKEKMNPAFGASIEALARDHVASLMAFQPEGPFVLGGWSAGAIIALEMARQLRACGREVPLLVALDGAPCNTGAGLRPRHPLYLLRLACNLPGWIRGQLRQNPSLHRLAREMFGKVALRRRMGGAFRDEQTLNGSEVQTLLDKNDWEDNKAGFVASLYEAMRNYVPTRYDGPVVVYEARTQPLDHLRQVGAAWKSIAPRTQIMLLPGDHAALFRHPLVDRVAADLRARIASV